MAEYKSFVYRKMLVGELEEPVPVSYAMSPA